MVMACKNGGKEENHIRQQLFQQSARCLFSELLTMDLDDWWMNKGDQTLMTISTTTTTSLDKKANDNLSYHHLMHRSDSDLMSSQILLPHSPLYVSATP
jgi:hypothetical protein